MACSEQSSFMIQKNESMEELSAILQPEMSITYFENSGNLLIFRSFRITCGLHILQYMWKNGV
jgi:hypothetical protein